MEQTMFGHDWESAQGTIIASRIKGFRVIGAGSGETPLHEFVVDVKKADGTTFRTTVEEPRSGKILPPDIGATVGVQVNHKDQSVRFDESDPSINTKVQWKKMHDAPDSFRAALEQAPGTPAP
jgi:hypothetical protein